MAIRAITGVPGAGKTFYAVKHLRDNYYRYEKESGCWVPKEGVTVISNINNFKLPHINLEWAIKESKKTTEQFFTVPYQESVIKKYKKVVYFIDECQNYFPYGFKNREVSYLFEYHRHLGLDFYLITQAMSLLPRGIKELCETEIHAIHRSVSFFGEFKYSVRASGHVLDTKIIKKDRSIFDLYKSMNEKETEKVKNPLKKYILGIFALLIIFIYLFQRSFFGGLLFGSQDKIEKKRVQRKASVHITESVKEKKIDLRDMSRRPLSYVVIGDRIMIVDKRQGCLIALKRYQAKKIDVVYYDGVLKGIFEYIDKDEERKEISRYAKIFKVSSDKKTRRDRTDR